MSSEITAATTAPAKNLNQQMSPSILDHFPFPAARATQTQALKAVEKWLRGDKKFFILEGPTGFGKSGVGIAAGSFAKTLPTFGEFMPGAYILSPQKTLTEQYMNDFAVNGLVELKGQANYFCPEFDMDCESASTVFEDMHNHSTCHGYKPAKVRFVESPLGVSNFAYYLSETTTAHQLPDRTLLVLDEGHNCFPKNTMVETEFGPKPIERVRAGEKVLAFLNGRYVLRPVSRVIFQGNKALWLLQTESNGDSRATKDQRFLTKRGWVELSQLKAGDRIISRHTGRHSRNLNSDQLQIVIGSYLGDGNLSAVPGGFRLRWNHGWNQAGYCAWKASVMGGCTKPVVKNGFSKKRAMEGRTPSFQLPGHKHVSNRKSAVPRWMLNQIDARGLAIWFMDDGSSIIRSGQLMGAAFHTESFSKKTCNLLRRVLLDKFGIETALSFQKKKYWVITLPASSARLLQDIILPYVQPSMLYKFVAPQQNLYEWDREESPFETVVRSVRPLTKCGGKASLVVETYDLEVAEAHNFLVRTKQRNSTANKYLMKSALVVHNCEDQILGFTDTTVRQKDCDSYEAGKLPIFKEGDIDAVANWLTETFVPAVQVKYRQLRQDFQKARQDGNSEEKSKIAKRLNAIDKFLKRIDMFVHAEQISEWFAYSDWDEFKKRGSGDLIIKPLTARLFAEPILFSKAQKILIMSATILDFKTFMRNLGIEESDAEILAVDSEFPVENRPIFFKEVGSMSYKSIQKTLPLMAEEVGNLLTKYATKKGIVFTQSYSTNKYLVDYVSATEHRGRVLTHSTEVKGSREGVIETHKAATVPTVIFSPSMTEGLDLKEDLGRFGIIVKVPYPALDPYVKARMQRDEKWYQWLTALKLVQASGRIVRSKTDRGHIWILDSAFRYFLYQASAILPKWWKESIIDMKKLNK